MYKVGLIGLGMIATGYSGPEDAAPYTHVGGINHSNKVELAAVADISAEAQARFRSKWGHCFPTTAFYNSAAAMFAAEKLDIVAICTPGPTHHAAVIDAIQAAPRAIFVEKPASCSLQEMDEMVNAAKAARIPITVSYTRHWGPRVLRMAQLIGAGLIGDVINVVGHCPGSFLSYAIHTTDMICQFANYQPRAVYARGRVESHSVPAGYEPEPSLVSMIIEFEGGITGTQIGQGEHGGFYCEVEGSQGRALIPFYGLPRAWGAKRQPLDLEQIGLPPNASPFKMAYDQIASYLDGGPLPDCSEDHFVAVNEIGFAAIESTLTQRRIELPNSQRTRKIYANG